MRERVPEVQEANTQINFKTATKDTKKRRLTIKLLNYNQRIRVLK